MFWIFWGPLRRVSEGQGPGVARAYKIAATYLTVQWLLYPSIVYAGPSYADVLGRTVETWLLVIVPFFSKVGFSALDLWMLRRLYGDPPSGRLEARAAP